MAKSNNPIDFAAATATQFSINPSAANTHGPNNLDVNGGVAIGSFAGVATAPANGLLVSGNVGIGTSSTAAFGYMTLIATPTINQNLFYIAGTSSFTTTTTVGAVHTLVGVGATQGNTITNGAGFDIGPNFSSNAGLITNACGIRIGPGTAGQGAAGATITNAYALFATTPTYAGTGTNIYTAYFQGATGFNVTNPLNLVDISGAVAIGSYGGVATAPANGLIVSGLAGFGTSSPNAAFQTTIAPTIVNSATLNSALNVAPMLTYNAVAPLSNQAIGLEIAPVTSTSSPTVPFAYGSVFTPQFTTSGTGSITSAYGLYIHPTQTVSGTGATAIALFGLYVNSGVSGSPTPINSYGIYVPAASGAVNNYTAYFATSATGGVGIGVAIPPDALDVVGNAAIGTYAGTTTAPADGLIVSGQVAIGTSSSPLASNLLLGILATPTNANLLVAANTPTTTTECVIGGTISNSGVNTSLYGFYNTERFSFGSPLTTDSFGTYANHALTVAASASVTNFYNNYFDVNSVALGASATILNAINLYALTPVTAMNNYCAYFQGTIYIPNGWTIGAPGGTSDICAAYVENGTYTPVLSGSTAAGAPTYTTRAGFFTQVGKRFFLDVHLVYSAIGGATGNIQVSVPLAARTVANMQFNGTVSMINVALPDSAGGLLGTNSTNPPSVVLLSGGTVCTFFSTQNATTGAAVPITPFTNPTTIQFSINYLVT